MRSWLLLLVLSLQVSFAQDNRGYYRYPALHGNTIVFTAEGDLWRVTTAGGLATRLTTHPAEELMAAFSPDGKTIAFSASYEGPREVYTMPAVGGLPTRRTFDGGDARVVGWTPGGKILYSTDRYSSLPYKYQLLTIDSGNHVATLPLWQASQGLFDAEGGTLFFTRFAKQPSYTKRYQGGMAENIWKFTGSGEATPLTGDYKGTSRSAMWWQHRIYFVTDRDGSMNIWSMDENGKKLQQHTHHRDFDVEAASLSDGKIAYQMGADLRVYDIASNTDKLIAIELPSDFDNLREHWVKTPFQYATSAHLSPDGATVVLTARGRAFVAPVKPGRFVDLTTHIPGRFREARMVPDGKAVIAISTESGETELWKYPANGEGKPEQLTKDAKSLRWEGIPSPDGKLVAHQDKDQQLWILDLATKADKRIAVVNDGDVDEPSFADLRWSPDSKWLSFAQNAKNTFTQIILYNIQTGKSTPLTDDRYNSGAASWSGDGKWIYFLSDRLLKTIVQAPWGSRQPEPYFDKTYKVYAVSLKKDVVSAFEPATELAPAEPPKADTPADADKDKNKEKSKTEPVKVDIDLDGIATRIQEAPVPPGNYSNLAAVGERLCWINHDPAVPENEHDQLQCMDIKNAPDNKPITLLDGVKLFETSQDGKKILVRKKDDLYVLDAQVSEGAMKDPKTLAEAQVDLKGWTFSVIPVQEFREEFQDAWRLHRDYFYDANMHNVGWPAMREKYLPLVDRVRDRQELSEVLAQMVAELSALHTFVHGGDLRKGPDQIDVAALGARLMRDDSAGGYRVEHIYKTDPDQPNKLSPLLRQGVKIQDGDVVTAINGQSVLSATAIGELLRGQAGKAVLVTYHAKDKAEPLHAVVRPMSVSEENDLIYSEWEYSRRRQVEEASGGHIGYIHLRAMGASDIARWTEEYSPIFDRDGLIIDMRHNFGGNIDSWVLDRLSRKAWMYWQARHGQPYWNMQGAFRGHMVVLCDELTASDGEAFSEGFRRLGLGKVIGSRTWGGEIWLSASNVLADNGIATAAEMGVYGPERQWLIEGEGVVPDTVVDNLPHSTFEGKDAQLEAGLALLEADIKNSPTPVPAPPPYPDKSITSFPRGSKATAGGEQHR